MPKRKILKDFDLDEISGVDRPAQPTATMSIIKRRADEANDKLAAAVIIAKAVCAKGVHGARAFADALVMNRVNDAMWPMTDALRNTLANVADDDELDPAAKQVAMSEAIDAFAAALSAITTGDIDPLTKFAENLLAVDLADHGVAKH